MKLIQFIQNQPTGYQAMLADYLGVNYSKVNTIMAKLRKWLKPNANEVELILRGVSLLEGKDYVVTDFQW